MPASADRHWRIDESGGVRWSRRRIDSEIQALSGHHRKRAAEKAGVSAVWCWITECSDQDAFMDLVLANNQGELSPLEYGLHLLEAVTEGIGGRGKKGGTAEYARLVGKKQQVLSDWRCAATVYKATGQPVGLLLDKATHLTAIHALPSEYWARVVEKLVAEPWSVAQVKAGVSAAREYLDVTGVNPDLEADYLVPDHCVAAIARGEVTANTFRQLSDLADRVCEKLERHGDLRKAWMQWLVGNAGGDSWHWGHCLEKRNELESVAFDRETRDLPPVPVIFADPPSTATIDEISSHIKAPSEIPDDAVLCLWATVENLLQSFKIMAACGFEYKTGGFVMCEELSEEHWWRNVGPCGMLLIGTRGSVSPLSPDPTDSWLFYGRTTPYEAIESILPNATRFEFYQKTPRDGWAGVN